MFALEVMPCNFEVHGAASIGFKENDGMIALHAATDRESREMRGRGCPRGRGNKRLLRTAGEPPTPIYARSVESSTSTSPI